MSQVLYILLGWVLGFFSPLIADFFKSLIGKREFVSALKVEFEDLQFRLTVASLNLLQSHGSLDKDFANWALKVIDRYKGYEPSNNIREFLHSFVSLDDETIKQLNEHAQAKEGIGSSLKTYQANFLESNLVAVSKLSISAQRRIHEVRNQLSILNQDISKAETYFMMTFNSSLGEGNHQRITDDLKGMYIRLQKRCKSLVDRIESILSEL
jgi:hypothetical protein